MITKTSALLRWSAIGGLCLLLAVLIPLTWITHLLSGGSLTVAERAKAKLARLKGGA